MVYTVVAHGDVGHSAGLTIGVFDIQSLLLVKGTLFRVGRAGAISASAEALPSGYRSVSIALSRCIQTLMARTAIVRRDPAVGAKVTARPVSSDPIVDCFILGRPPVAIPSAIPTLHDSTLGVVHDHLYVRVDIPSMLGARL